MQDYRDFVVKLEIGIRVPMGATEFQLMEIATRAMNEIGWKGKRPVDRLDVQESIRFVAEGAIVNEEIFRKLEIAINYITTRDISEVIFR